MTDWACLIDAGGGREHLIDDRHLCGMYRHLADKAVARSLFAFAAKALVVAKINIDGVDRGYLRCGCAGKAQHPRQPVRIEKVAVGVAIGLRAELGGKVLGAPGQRA